MESQENVYIADHIQPKYRKWRKQNEHVFNMIQKYAYEVLASGRTRYGIAAIVERVRWHVNVQTKGEDFKMPNNFRSRIARDLIAEDPRFAEVFRTASLRAGSEGRD